MSGELVDMEDCIGDKDDILPELLAAALAVGLLVADALEPDFCARPVRSASLTINLTKVLTNPILINIKDCVHVFQKDIADQPRTAHNCSCIYVARA